MSISRAEIERRYHNLRAAMQREGMPALLVCGNQYTGFEGAVRYTSGFEIVHRYVYVLIPLEGEPTLIFPREARWIGDKSAPWVREHVWPELPGLWVRERCAEKGWKKLAVYGMDAVMAVRDYRELAGAVELVNFDFHFDMARAVKSEEEFTHIRESLDIILDGFQALLRAYQPGRTEAEIMAPAVERFFARGAGPRMMNILLSGSNGTAEAFFKVPTHRKVAADDLLLYSLEIANSEGYWVEFSRALIKGKLSPVTERMKAVYSEALEAARLKMRDGERASEVHRAAADIFAKAGFGLGHLSGHSIGVTMIEHPAIGATSSIELRENMVLSFHPQVVDQDGKVCLYTQDMYRVGKREGENLCAAPWKLYTGEEAAGLRGTVGSGR
ncbi:MAG: M24 family metallopeptidase [Candidatus Acidiferrales bacterium]